MTTPLEARLVEDEETEDQQGPSAIEGLHTAADTIGMVPNVRAKDNLIQGLVIGAGTVVSTVVGLCLGGGVGAAIGAVAGLIGFLLISGGVLMVVGWVRTAKKMK